jgi:hypothetical protein
MKPRVFQFGSPIIQYNKYYTILFYKPTVVCAGSRLHLKYRGILVLFRGCQEVTTRQAELSVFTLDMVTPFYPIFNRLNPGSARLMMQG